MTTPNDRLEKKVDEIMREQIEQRQTLTQVRNALTGDNMGNKGVFHILPEHDKAINELKESEKKRKWFIAGFASAFGFISGLVGGPFLKWLASKILIPAAAKIAGIIF